MKANFEFNLPEDREEYEIYSKAMDYYCTITDIDQELRSCIKYGYDESKIKDPTAAFEHIRHRLHEILSDRGASLD